MGYVKSPVKVEEKRVNSPGVVFCLTCSKF